MKRLLCLGLMMIATVARAEDAFKDGAAPIVVTPPIAITMPPITVAPQIVITPQITILPPTITINPPQVRAAPPVVAPRITVPRIRYNRYRYYDDCCDGYMTNLSVPADRVMRSTPNCNGVGC